MPDSTASLHLCTRRLVIPELESNHELRVGPYCSHRAVPSAFTCVLPIPEGLQEHPTQPSRPQGEREMAAASEIISGKEPRGRGLRSQHCKLSALLGWFAHFTTRLALLYRPECLCRLTVLTATPPLKHLE